MAKQLTIRKHLTNAEVIALLKQKDPSAEINVLIDFSLWDSSADYPEITDADGLCYVVENDQLVINAGEFEC